MQKNAEDFLNFGKQLGVNLKAVYPQAQTASAIRRSCGVWMTQRPEGNR